MCSRQEISETLTVDCFQAIQLASALRLGIGLLLCARTVKKEQVASECDFIPPRNAMKDIHTEATKC